MPEWRTVRVDRKTHARLSLLRDGGETYNDAVRKALDEAGVGEVDA